MGPSSTPLDGAGTWPQNLPPGVGHRTTAPGIHRSRRGADRLGAALWRRPSARSRDVEKGSARLNAGPGSPHNISSLAEAKTRCGNSANALYARERNSESTSRARFPGGLATRRNISWRIGRAWRMGESLCASLCGSRFTNPQFEAATTTMRSIKRLLGVDEVPIFERIQPDMRRFRRPSRGMFAA